MPKAGREELERAQLDSLRGLLATLKDGPNAFYVPRLAEAGIDEAVASLAEFSERMPFTTKQELVEDHAAYPPFGTNLTYPLGSYTRFNQTSGTSGEPIAWIDTPESWEAMLECWDLKYRVSEVGQGDVVFFAFSFGPFLGFWTAFEAAVRRGCMAISGGGMSTEARLGAIARNGATVLCCTPTYALRLGEAARGQGLTDMPVKKIIVAGEPGGSIPSTRARIQDLWNGARVYDHHGMTETGPVSFEHTEHERHLCIMEEAFYAEVLDTESGAEVGEGGTGELVLTTLKRKACPLLRYRTGDLVRKCYLDFEGTPLLSLEGGILGRIDDMVVVRGVNLYPGAVESVMRTFDSVVEYQVRLRTERSMTEIEVRIEAADPGGAEPLRRDVESALRDRFALRIPVTLVDSGTLPRSEFKSRRWIIEADA